MDSDLIRQTYKGKKVFLTGHTGFKGSWLLYWLKMLDAEVKGYSLNPLNNNDLFHLIKGSQICHSVIADIRDKKRLEKELIEFNPDFVFHLAAQPLVRLSYEIPSETFEVNAVGTAFLLDAVTKLEKACQVILVTTDKVYDNNEWIYPYRENDRLGGYDPYSASKACAELVISSYRNSFFHTSKYSSHKKAISVARAGNVIGGGDWAKDRIIPDMVKALNEGEAVKVRNPKAVRPWQHVLEPLGGYLLLGAKLYQKPLDFSEAFNFGPYLEDNLTVEELVATGLKIWGKGNYITSASSAAPHEAGLLKLDISKAVSKLGWTPKYNAQAAIEKTLTWYRKFYSGEQSPEALVESDISSYVGN